MKNEKGFTLIELSISIVAFVLFAIIVANLNYSIFSNSIQTKQNAILTEKAIEILELVGTMDIETDFDEEGDLLQNSSLYSKLVASDSKYSTIDQSIKNKLKFKNKENENIEYIVKFEDYVSYNNEAEKNIVKIVTVIVTKDTDEISIKRVLKLK